MLDLMNFNTFCDDWGEGSGLEIFLKDCSEDNRGNHLLFIFSDHYVFMYNVHMYYSLAGFLFPKIEPAGPAAMTRS